MRMVDKMTYAAKPKNARLNIILFLGIFLLISGIIILFLWPTIAGAIETHALSLHDGSNVYQTWRKTPGESFLEIYMHNWTNARDGHNDTVKPKFEEVGPFRFRELKEKVNVTWNENGTVSYMLKKTWWFDEKSSCCNLSTKITTLNAVLVNFAHRSRSWNPFLLLSLNVGLKALTPDLHVTKEARELLFEGYKDHMLDLSGMSPSGKFGWFYGKNDSYKMDGLFNMDARPRYKGLLRNWNAKAETNFYQGECSKVYGSAGELYPPGQIRETASFFTPDMCRNVALDYERDVDIHGLVGYKYRAHHSMLDNGTLIPEKECFCNGQCMPYGIVNVTSCKGGAPAFISLPHFLHADPSYRSAIDGMHPDVDKHQFFIVLEPNTGLPLQASVRMQMNFHLQPISFMNLINDVPDVIFPIFWFQVQMKSSEAFASQLKLLLKLPTLIKSIALTVIAVSVIMIIISLCGRRKRIAEKLSKELVPLQNINR